MTKTEISNLTTLQVVFINGKWKVILEDENNLIYVIKIEGLSTDTNTTISNNIYDELITIDKKVVPVNDSIIERDKTEVTPTQKI